MRPRQATPDACRGLIKQLRHNVPVPRGGGILSPPLLFDTEVGVLSSHFISRERFKPVGRLAVTVVPFFSWTGFNPSYTKLVVVPPVLISVEALIVLPCGANSFRLTAHRTRSDPRGVPVECKSFPAQPPPSSLASRAPMAPQASG